MRGKIIVSAFFLMCVCDGERQGGEVTVSAVASRCARLRKQRVAYEHLM